MTINELTPGLWRGIFDFDVITTGGSYNYDFSRDLFALNGPGQLSISFSRFPGLDFRAVQSITIDVGRFEPGFHIGLDSITTIPEPSAVTLSVLGLVLMIRRSCLRNR